MEFPVHLRDLRTEDPFILADRGTNRYYLYAARLPFDPVPEREGAVYASVSEDLVRWSAPVCVFPGDKEREGCVCSGPEVYARNGAFYLIAAFSEPGFHKRIRALRSESPLGPFVPVGEPLTPPGWECSDGTLYTDRQGRSWLIFSHDWVQVYDGQICAVEVDDTLACALGRPLILFRGSEAPWGDDFMYSSRPGGGGAASGPSVYRTSRGELLILWTNQTPYGAAIGVARSRDGELTGEWEQLEKPLYAIGGKHPCLFRRLDDDRLLMVFCSDAEEKNGPVTLMATMEEYWRTGLLEVIHECTGNFRFAMGGHALAYRGDGPTLDEPTFTVMQDYGGPFAKKIMNWAMAPETPFRKGKIASRD